MRCLGLDTSTTSTGYAVVEKNKIISYGSIRPDKKIDTVHRIIYIAEELKRIIVEQKVEYITIEDLAVTRNANVTKILAGLLYYLVIEFTKMDMLVVTARPSEIRKGKLHAKKREDLKRESMKYVKDNFNIDVSNDDESDSILVALYGESVGVE